MTVQAKDFWKTWGSMITTVITGIALFWSISKEVASIAYSDIKELHKNTADHAQLQMEVSKMKADKLESDALQKITDTKQDYKIDKLIAKYP